MKRTVAFSLCLLPSFASAASLSEAKAKFAQRDSSKQAAEAAIGAYADLLKSSPAPEGKDFIEAAEGLLRSEIYYATRYLSTADEEQKAERKKIFRQCWSEDSLNFSAAKLGQNHPAFYYFKASCLAYEAEVSNVFQRLALLPDLLSTLDEGLKLPQASLNYEGGGLLRVKAAVKGNPEAKGIPGGLYNPTEALGLIDGALSAEAFEGQSAGKLYCENHRRKALILEELGQKDQALKLKEEALKLFGDELAQGRVLESIRAETQLCVGELQGSKLAVK